MACSYATLGSETHSQAQKRKYHDQIEQSSVHSELLNLLRTLPDQ